MSRHNNCYMCHRKIKQGAVSVKFVCQKERLVQPRDTCIADKTGKLAFRTYPPEKQTVPTTTHSYRLCKNCAKYIRAIIQGEETIKTEEELHFGFGGEV